MQEQFRSSAGFSVGRYVVDNDSIFRRRVPPPHLYRARGGNIAGNSGRTTTTYDYKDNRTYNGGSSRQRQERSRRSRSPVRNYTRHDDRYSQSRIEPPCGGSIGLRREPRVLWCPPDLCNGSRGQSPPVPLCGSRGPNYGEDRTFRPTACVTRAGPSTYKPSYHREYDDDHKQKDRRETGNLIILSLSFLFCLV